MLFITLGKLDFITVLILMGAAILPRQLMLYAAIYLLIKGLIFILLSRDLASYGDFASGIYLLLLSYGIQIPYLHSIVLFYLFQKSILTFIAVGIQLFILYYEYRDRDALPSFLR